MEEKLNEPMFQPEEAIVQPASLSAPPIKPVLEVEEIAIIETDPDTISQKDFIATLPTIGSSMDVERSLWAIRRCERSIETLSKQAAESNQFYALRTEQLKERIVALKENIKDFLTVNGVQNVVVPSGTVSKKITRSVVYGSDESLLNWAKTHFLDGIRTVELPAKDKIRAHILKTGELPPDVMIEEVTTINIRRR